MRRPNRGSVLGLILGCGLSAFGTSAFASSAEPSAWLELDAGPGSAMHSLTPGGSAQWPVNVHVRGEPATNLEVTLRTEPAATDLLGSFLSVELHACSQPWVQGRCGAGERVLMERTALGAAGGLRADLMAPGSLVSEGAYVQLTAFLAEGVPREVQGSRTQIVVLVHGSGDDAGNGLPVDAGTGSLPGQPAGPPSGNLAITGARLGGCAFLGMLAVAVGFGLARLRAAAA